MKKRYFNLASIILVLASFVACRPQTPSTPTGTQLVKEKNWAFEPGVRTTGIVVPRLIVNLSFPASGQLTELLVQEGDTVRAGEIIARQATTALEADIREAETALAAAQAGLEKVLVGPHPALVKEAQSKATAAAAVSSSTGVQATAQAADLAAVQAQLEYLMAQPLPEDLAIAQAEVEQAKTRLETSRARLEKAVLVAPISGTIIHVFIQAYEYALEGEAVVQISDLAQLKIEAPMDDLDVVDLTPGDSVIVSFEALPDLEVDAVVANIQPNSENDQTKNFIVTFKFAQLPEEVRWGMTAEVTIPNP